MREVSAEMGEPIRVKRKRGSWLVTHGKTGTNTHRIWIGVRQRCQQPLYKGYPQYGGRGIKLCARWQKFANFLADMSRAPYSLRTWLLRAVSGECGPATKNVLRGIARSHGYLEQFDQVFRQMLDAGELVMFGARKDATYGLPRRRRS